MDRQLDIPDTFPVGSPAMACPYYAAIFGAGCWRWNRPFHCVSVYGAPRRRYSKFNFAYLASLVCVSSADFGFLQWSILLSYTSIATNGLGVIGGDTVNLVGLGGCTADSKFVC